MRAPAPPRSGGRPRRGSRRPSHEPFASSQSVNRAVPRGSSRLTSRPPRSPSSSSRVSSVSPTPGREPRPRRAPPGPAGGRAGRATRSPRGSPRPSLEREDLGSGGVPGDVVVARRRLEGQGGEVLHGDRLDPVPAVARDAEDRQPAQQPGDRVREDRLVTEQDRRPQDRVRHTRCRERRLDLRLAPVVREMRGRIRVRDADVDDPPHARRTGRLEQDPRVADGLRRASRPRGETGPSTC